MNQHVGIGTFPKVSKLNSFLPSAAKQRVVFIFPFLKGKITICLNILFFFCLLSLFFHNYPVFYIHTHNEPTMLILILPPKYQNSTPFYHLLPSSRWFLFCNLLSFHQIVYKIRVIQFI